MTVKSIAVTLGLLALVGTSGYYYVNGNYSDGSRTGTVVKISRKGNLGFKTWEGQLSIGGVSREGPNAGTNLWDFSIDRLMDDHEEEVLVGKLKSAMDEGYPVVIDYDQKRVQLDVRGDTDYFVTDIRRVGKKRP